MARPKIKRKGLDWKELLGEEKEFFKKVIQEVVQEVLESEMDDTVGARKGERTADRSGYRSGYYSRRLTTRVGKLGLRAPQDRAGRFSTEVFERYQRARRCWCPSWPRCTYRACRPKGKSDHRGTVRAFVFRQSELG